MHSPNQLLNTFSSFHSISVKAAVTLFSCRLKTIQTAMKQAFLWWTVCEAVKGMGRHEPGALHFMDHSRKRSRCFSKQFNSHICAKPPTVTCVLGAKTLHFDLKQSSPAISLDDSRFWWTRTLTLYETESPLKSIPLFLKQAKTLANIRTLTYCLLTVSVPVVVAWLEMLRWVI